MTLIDAAALLLVLAAAFGLFNHHVLKLPFAIGMMVSGLIGSLGVMTIDHLVPSWNLAATARYFVDELHFADTVLNGMLSLMLFAGALHTDISRLKQRLPVIISLASLGVILSAVAAGFTAHFLFGHFGIHVPLIWCLAFGALISPTDPIAVLGVMKAARAPEEIEAKVIGESLFNDGTGVVLFTIFMGIGVAMSAGGAQAAEASVGGMEVIGLLAKEILGGLLLGLVAGYVCYRAFRTLDEPNLEVLMTFATVFVIGSLAIRWHLSGPLAAVAAGLFIGNRGRIQAMSDATAQNLDVVWSFIDESLNAVLFLLIGLIVVAIDTRMVYLYAGLCLVPAVLLARFVGVAIPVFGMRIRRVIGAGTVRVLTWGGLKGGVSVALAMKLPEFEGRNAILTVTYVVVVFSIVVQGLTIGPLLRRLYPAGAAEAPAN